MNQYIELYKDNKALINANSAPALNAFRDEACAMLEKVGLNKAKDFSATDPEALLAPDYSLNLARHNVPTDRSDLFTCGIPDMSTYVHYMVNEQYIGETRKIADSQGVFAGSLREFAEKYPNLIAKYYNQQAGKDPITPESKSNADLRMLGESALNTMLAQDGFVLYVPDGVEIEKPLQLISLMRSVDDFMACQRLLIVIGEGAKASLLVCEHASDLADVKLLNLQVAEVFVGKNATFDFYSLEEHKDNVIRLSEMYVRQEEGSNAAFGEFTLAAGKTRNRVYIDLAGEQIDTNIFGMVIADGEQQVDNITFIDHKKSYCNSNELFKYVLDGEAKGSFIGRILVRDGAIKTDAHQTDRNLCLTDKARMIARPELEIYADDVKCSHGATVGQLDQNALFYMRTRGIPEDEARMLLMFAFMGDVIDNIRIEPLKDRLKHLVEKRFRGELTQCKNCKIK